MQHIKDQNWFAILIEVMVVVVGIFLALQADNWKQAVEDASKDKRALILFSEELVTMIDRADGDIKSSKDSALMYDQLLGHFTNCTDVKKYDDFFVEVIKFGRRLRGLNIMRAGLDSIAQPTVLARLDNADLSRSVSRILEVIDFWNIRHAIEAPEFLANYRKFSSHYEVVGALAYVEKDNYLESSNKSVEYRFDLEAICEDREFRKLVRDISIAHKRQYEIFADWKSTLVSAHNATELLLKNY